MISGTTPVARLVRQLMATNDKTIDRLQYLEVLYRQGYRSDVIDRSLDKIIALERVAAQRDLADLQERLRTFEARYRMPSEEFVRRWAKIPEADDKYLRVILSEDRETVHNAFFDCTFREG
jgi:hypothetical protein